VNKAFAAGAFDISVYWSGAAVRSAKQLKLPVDFIVPKEGAIGWLDGLRSRNEHKEGSRLKFINYMIDPGFYFTWATQGRRAASPTRPHGQRPPMTSAARCTRTAICNLRMMSALPDDRRQAFADAGEIKAFYAR